MGFLLDFIGKGIVPLIIDTDSYQEGVEYIT